MGQPMPTPFISSIVHVPKEKVGCLQVTQTLQQFLDKYPPKTWEQAFKTIYHALEQLEDYLSENPQQIANMLY